MISVPQNVGQLSAKEVMKLKHTANKPKKKNLGDCTSAWGSESLGGASTESKQLSIANRTRSFPGVGNGTLDTICAITSHSGLLKLL